MAIEANRVVHESELQRQHVRVRLPATIEFEAEGGRRCHRLNDVSAGGFSFSVRNEPYSIGSMYTGHIVLSVNTVGFSIPVHFEVSHAGGDRVACQFQDLGPQEIAALRLVITSYLGGELITSGDMLATLSRENFAPPRSTRGTGALTGRARLRAVLGTTLALVIGVTAFAYTVTKLYDIVMVTHATAAKVAARTYTITMPRDGTFFSLVPLDGKVKKGQPLGSFQTALLDVVAGVPGSFKLTPEELANLVGQQLSGSIASPCDCIVQTKFVTDAQYVLRNQSLLELIPQQSEPYVLARFHYNEMTRLPVGRNVQISVNGSQSVSGTVSELRVLPAPTIDSNGLDDLNGLDTSAAITDVIAVIKASVPLDRSLIDDPVDVRIDPLIGGLARFGWPK
jgi:alginate biosynthesis protein Alg44